MFAVVSPRNSEGVVDIYSSDDFSKLKSVSCFEGAKVVALCFSVDGRLLATGSENGIVCVNELITLDKTTAFDLNLRKGRNRYSAGDRIGKLCFGKCDNKHLFVRTSEWILKWNLHNQQRILEIDIRNQYCASIEQLIYLHSQDWIMAPFGGNRQLNRLKIWNASTAENVNYIKFPYQPLSVAVSCLENVIAVALEQDGRIVLFNISDCCDFKVPWRGELLHPTTRGVESESHFGNVKFMEFSSDGERLISTNLGTTVVWHVASFECLGTVDHTHFTDTSSFCVIDHADRSPLDITLMFANPKKRVVTGVIMGSESIVEISGMNVARQFPPLSVLL